MRILIVDDIEILRHLISMTVTLMSPMPEVREASNAKEAIKIIEAQSIDVVISDYEMPGGNGGELFQYIQKKHPEIKFILSSSWSPDQLQEFRTCKSKLTGYVPKPFTRAAVTQVLVDSGILKEKK